MPLVQLQEVQSYVLFIDSLLIVPYYSFFSYTVLSVWSPILQ